MVSKDIINWNILTEKNISECLSIVNNYDFKRLELSESIEDFISNISSNHNCDTKVLLYTILSGIGHFAESINVYNMETKQVKPISVYEVLIAPSGVEKSKYINIISNACTKLEQYIYENYYKKQRTFTPAGIDPIIQESEERKKNSPKAFDFWVNEFGSIKQVYTTPSLLQMMSTTSIFFLANEGDAILQESSFYNPSDVTADIKQGTLIDCWDGNKIVKSTITHGSREIKHRTVSICVASTGRRWPDLLRELSKVQMAGGLHERCSYFCFDITNVSSRAQLTLIAEQNFYESLYDDLLSVSRVDNQINYSLAQVFFIIKLFGHRVCVWSREAFTFVQPRLDELKTNKPCKFTSDTTVFQTKQQMALRRRSAEHVVRYSCLLQMFFNSLYILNSMNDHIIKSSGGRIVEAFEIEAKHKINNLFGAALERDNSYYENGVPLQPLEVGINAATSAVALVFNLLLPQAVLLFNYEGVCENKVVNSLVFNDINMTMTKEEKTVLQIEKHIMKLKLKFFHKSCITDHHFRDKRSLVNNVLNDLVHRQLLYQAEDNKSFFDTGRVSTINTYLKFLPSANDEERFGNALLSLYNIELKEYQKNFEDAPLLPPNCKLTSYAMEFIRKAPYESVINRTNNNSSNEPAAGITIATTQSIVNFQVSIGNNNDVEHEQSTSDFNNINEHSSVNDLVSLNQTRTTVDSNLAKNNNFEIHLGNSYKRSSLSSTITDKPQQAKDHAFDSAFIQSNAGNPGQILIAQNNNEEATVSDRLIHVDDPSIHVDDPSIHVDDPSMHVDDPSIHVDDDSSSLLSSINEEDTAAQTQKLMSQELCSTESSDKTNTHLQLSEHNKATNYMIDLQKLYGKILSIPSILLTKGLISAHIKISAGEMKRALNYLMEKQLLRSGKYLQCARRKIEAYLKYVPENIEGRTDKYVLQGRLLDLDVNVNDYIESLKTMELITTSLRPSDLLINTLQKTPYVQLNIDLSIKHTDTSVEKEIDKDEASSNYEYLVGKVRRKKIKPNSENE